MHLSTTIVTSAIICLLATGVTAASLRRQNDLHIADFRSWGDIGCDQDNQGIWTFTQSQLTGCKSFASFQAPNVKSVTVYNLNQGCSLIFYTDEACTEKPVQPEVAKCQSEASLFKSFLLACEE